MEPQTNPTPPTEPTAAPAEATAPASQTEIPAVPETWPGAFGLYKHSAKVVKLIFITVLGLWLLSIGIGIVFGMLLGSENQDLRDLLSGIVSLVLSVSFISTYLAGIRGQKLSFGEALATIKPMTVVNMFFLYILTDLVLVFSVLALVIPFFIVAPRILLACNYVIDRQMGPIAALKASWVATKGHSGKLWGIFGVFILIILPVFTLIGIPVSIYFGIMYSAALVILYEFLNKQQVPEAATPTAPSPEPATNPEPPISPTPGQQPPATPPVV